MNADKRVMAIARVLAGLRQALGVAPDTRADLIAAFAAGEGELEKLHAAIGRVIGMCDKQARTHG